MRLEHAFPKGAAFSIHAGSATLAIIAKPCDDQTVEVVLEGSGQRPRRASADTT